MNSNGQESSFPNHSTQNFIPVRSKTFRTGHSKPPFYRCGSTSATTGKNRGLRHNFLFYQPSLASRSRRSLVMPSRHQSIPIVRRFRRPVSNRCRVAHDEKATKNFRHRHNSSRSESVIPPLAEVASHVVHRHPRRPVLRDRIDQVV